MLGLDFRTQMLLNLMVLFVDTQRRDVNKPYDYVSYIDKEIHKDFELYQEGQLQSPLQIVLFTISYHFV